jgi:hypothetical protein
MLVKTSSLTTKRGKQSREEEREEKRAKAYCGRISFLRSFFASLLAKKTIGVDDLLDLVGLYLFRSSESDSTLL